MSLGAGKWVMGQQKGAEIEVVGDKRESRNMRESSRQKMRGRKSKIRK